MESILKSELERQLLTRVGEVMEPLGFRPVDLDAHVGGRSIVRIYIERMRRSDSLPEAEQNASLPEEVKSPGTSLEDCTQVSRVLGPILEADPSIPGAFDLEVSSPGLDRRLRLRPDFDAAVGHTVKLKLVEKLEGRGQNITGTLSGAAEQGVTVTVGKDEVSIPWNTIKQAIRVWDFNKH